MKVIKAFGGEDSTMGKAGPCYVACGLAILAALISLFCLPRLDQDCLQKEDQRFRVILRDHGYRTERMGVRARHESYDIENGKDGIQLKTVEDY